MQTVISLSSSEYSYTPEIHADFLSISITLLNVVMTRIMARIITEIICIYIIYIQLFSLHLRLLHSLTIDQYALRPRSSTTAALIIVLHKMTDLLTTNQYMSLHIVIALDSSEVRYSSSLNADGKVRTAGHSMQIKFMTG